MTGVGSIIKPLILSLLVALIIGWMFDAMGWSVAGALALLLLYQARQTLALRRWLHQTEQDPPEARGLWGVIFDQLYHQKRQTRREHDQLQAVISRMQDSSAALRDGVIMLDAQGNLEWWNPSTERLLGLKKPHDLGQPITNLIRHPSFQHYFNHGDYQTPLELASPLHHALHLQYQITEYGQGLRLILVRDVSHIHQLEQMRKDFVANVSHELRTPLTVIKGYLETLLEHEHSLAPPWQRALAQMQEQSVRMQHLLDDLLLLARLEATELPQVTTVIDVAKLLQQIREDAQALSAEKQQHIVLTLEPGLALRGDQSELRSAFSNVIFNAVRYSPAHSTITVRFYRADDGAHLVISDQGPGIEARHLPRLTERFYRVDSSRHSASGGTGLGLAIVKHVLLRHQGELHIDSQVGVGSRFDCHFQPSQLVQQHT